ncbi:hypothetical protein [Aquamicrobium zhengzhouense]|uniref:hypothetical protein n=1 Tax=Aquamicrobium zhengzhouense TaxID=2781738 RepID=UPI001F3583FA|nr:hypothetical protein [Aquamicrobium zhengzhouense]
MDKLDTIVTDRITDRLLAPQRVEKLLTGLIERQANRSADYTDRVANLRKNLSDTEARLKRLYDAIENGIADPSEEPLKDRITAIKTERDIAQVTLDRTLTELRPEARITQDKIAAFTAIMRDNI